MHHVAAGIHCTACTACTAGRCGTARSGSPLGGQRHQQRGWQWRQLQVMPCILALDLENNESEVWEGQVRARSQGTSTQHKHWDEMEGGRDLDEGSTPSCHSYLFLLPPSCCLPPLPTDSRHSPAPGSPTTATYSCRPRIMVSSLPWASAALALSLKAEAQGRG